MWLEMFLRLSHGACYGLFLMLIVGLSESDIAELDE